MDNSSSLTSSVYSLDSVNANLVAQPAQHVTQSAAQLVTQSAARPPSAQLTPPPCSALPPIAQSSPQPDLLQDLLQSIAQSVTELVEESLTLSPAQSAIHLHPQPGVPIASGPALAPAGGPEEPVPPQVSSAWRARGAHQASSLVSWGFGRTQPASSVVSWRVRGARPATSIHITACSIRITACSIRHAAVRFRCRQVPQPPRCHQVPQPRLHLCLVLPLCLDPRLVLPRLVLRLPHRHQLQPGRHFLRTQQPSRHVLHDQHIGNRGLCWGWSCRAAATGPVAVRRSCSAVTTGSMAGHHNRFVAAAGPVAARWKSCTSTNGLEVGHLNCFRPLPTLSRSCLFCRPPGRPPELCLLPFGGGWTIELSFFFLLFSGVVGEVLGGAVTILPFC